MKVVLVLILLVIFTSTVSYAQVDGVPMPGAENVIDVARTPGGSESSVRRNGAVQGQTQSGSSSPLPGSFLNYQGNNSGKNQYQLLPISVAEAKTRLEELKTLMLISQPKAIQDKIYNLCDWLSDMTEAHNKLANAFGRQEETKAISLTERAMAQKFSQLKNEAQLLKAELLIKQNRAPEALGSLIDIVCADPRGATGKAAYNHLKELGFSEEVPAQITAEQTKKSDSLAPAPKQGTASKSEQSANSSSKAGTYTNQNVSNIKLSGGSKAPVRNIVKVNR
jgi:hypothetical protein